jgi:DNA (cytosine-5)-methyltransferase 1
MRCVWQVEIDPYCRKVLTKHWPDVPKWDDVRTFTGEDFERPDVICGGFPCQDISSAGKKVGIGGEQSGLWRQFSRIVRLVRPRLIVVENVAALLNGDLGQVLGDLSKCGYDAEWETLPAGLFGAPHLRARTFVVGYSDINSKSDCPVNDETSWMPALVANAEHAWREQRGNLARAWGEQESLPWNADGECVDPSLAIRVDDGLPNRMDRLSGLGNAVVPQVAEFIGRRLMEHE